jgi:acyl-CoA thioesterase
MDGDHRLTAAEILERFNGSRPPAIETLGGEVIAVEPETGRLTFRFRPTVAMCHSIHIPEGGIVQGGFVAGWLDTSMAHACSARSNFTLRHPTLELKVSYLAPAHPNRVYYVDAEIVRWGRTIAFLEARLRDEHQRLVATASATAMLMPAK